MPSQSPTKKSGRDTTHDALFLQVRRDTMKTAYIPKDIRKNYKITYDVTTGTILISSK